ncbi:hypothetical protein HF521_016072 [Silurus meridionalis]|uniref:Ig-like domain-containing protein n=2 Tax=Silurus meridionalis TaxID=175797 RepID=A0A8T0BPJ6_SILME|nr:hypothetical protein HF521_016072 [Silurus meridionalis]
MLYLAIITLLFLRAVFTTSLQQINKTASTGKTVILHCNQNLTGGFKDVGWRKDGNLLFNYSPVLNQTVINYTSNRMQVDPQNARKLQISDVQLSDAGLYKCYPLNLQWRLRIDETELQQGRKSYIIFTVATTSVVVCLFIFCAVCLFRKQKNRETETGKTIPKIYKDNVCHSETITECVYTMTSPNDFSIGYL